MDRLLQEIGIKGRTRDSSVMRALSSALTHPARIAESGFLNDDDPLKISARCIIEDFEAVTNGMSRPDPGDTVIIIDEESPLYPWRLLTEAVASFYEGNTKAMIDTVRQFPEKSAVANLRSTFEILAGKPLPVNEKNIFIEKIRVIHKELSLGLEILDEASSYPDLLRKEIGYYVREMSKENPEAGKRLYYWAMKVLSEEEPLSEKDEMPSVIQGAGEASRICALASIHYDPERALTAWLRSLHTVLEAEEISPAELSARLEIAEELLKKAEEENLLSADIITNIITYLNHSYPLIKNLLPAVPLLPLDTEGLQQWLTGTVKDRVSAAADRRPRRKTKRNVSTELFLFDEVS